MCKYFTLRIELINFFKSQFHRFYFYNIGFVFTLIPLKMLPCSNLKVLCSIVFTLIQNINLLKNSTVITKFGLSFVIKKLFLTLLSRGVFRFTTFISKRQAAELAGSRHVFHLSTNQNAYTRAHSRFVYFL